jgi:hypothetical protein
MEKRISFDEWLANYVPPELIYFAVFEPESGQVVGIYPGHAAEDIEHKILIDNATAEAIINGDIKMSNCFVDGTGEALDIAETKNLVKIDDVLHRIVDVKYTPVDDPDIVVSYSKKDQTLKFELSENLSGTRKNGNTARPKKIYWSGETEMIFLITEYNDPNSFIDSISFTVSDLQEKPFVVEKISVPEKFSIYTRRIFEKYAFEELCEQ